MDNYTDKIGVRVYEVFDGTAVLYKDHKAIGEFDNVCEAYDRMEELNLEETFDL